MKSFLITKDEEKWKKIMIGRALEAAEKKSSSKRN